MGWDRILLSVPLFCSEFIASNPRLMPSKGPRKLIKMKNDGIVPSDIVNNFRKKKARLGSSGFTAFPIFVNAVYIEPRHVKAIITINITNRQLLT
jgi:hypothetical protein